LVHKKKNIQLQLSEQAMHKPTGGYLRQSVLQFSRGRAATERSLHLKNQPQNIREKREQAVLDDTIELDEDGDDIRPAKTRAPPKLKQASLAPPVGRKTESSLQVSGWIRRIDSRSRSSCNKRQTRIRFSQRSQSQALDSTDKHDPPQQRRAESQSELFSRKRNKRKANRSGNTEGQEKDDDEEDIISSWDDQDSISLFLNNDKHDTMNRKRERERRAKKPLSNSCSFVSTSSSSLSSGKKGLHRNCSWVS